MCCNLLLVPLAVLALDLAEERPSTASSDELALSVRHFHPDVSFQLSSTCRVWCQESRTCARVQKRFRSCARSGARLGSLENSGGKPRSLCQLLRLALLCHGKSFCHRFFCSIRRFLQLRCSTLGALSLELGSGALDRSVFHFLRSKGRQGSSCGATFVAGSLCRRRRRRLSCALHRLGRFPRRPRSTALGTGLGIDHVLDE